MLVVRRNREDRKVPHATKGPQMPYQNLPAVIVVAATPLPALDGGPSAAEYAVPSHEALAATVGGALSSGLPVTVVANSAQAARVAGSIARRDLVLMPDSGVATPASMIARAVSDRAESAGWIVLPGGHRGVHPDTLRRVAEALRVHPVAYAEHLGHRSYPIGFAAGLYSDLVSGAPEDAPHRLVARYPAAAVEVDDPAVLAVASPPVPAGAGSPALPT